MTFTGRVDSTFGIGSTSRDRDREGEWIAACPLWTTDESGSRRRIVAPGFVLDLFGFSPASDAELAARGHQYARNGDLIGLDSIVTGSGVLVIRQPQQVTIVTDLAGVWPVFYAVVAQSLIYSSSAASIAAEVGAEVNEQWLATRLLAGSVPETWSEGSPYRRLRAVPAGGVLLVNSGARSVVVHRELPLAVVKFGEGAQQLAGALSAAVRSRTQAHRVISTDLSGGLDSSTVAAIAATGRPEPMLPAITLVCAELHGDDPAHARRVACEIPGLGHHELPLPSEVDPYAALTEIPHTDEPCQSSLGCAGGWAQCTRWAVKYT